MDEAITSVVPYVFVYCGLVYLLVPVYSGKISLDVFLCDVLLTHSQLYDSLYWYGDEQGWCVAQGYFDQRF